MFQICVGTFCVAGKEARLSVPAKSKTLRSRPYRNCTPSSLLKATYSDAWMNFCSPYMPFGTGSAGFIRDARVLPSTILRLNPKPEILSTKPQDRPEIRFVAKYRQERLLHVLDRKLLLKSRHQLRFGFWVLGFRGLRVWSETRPTQCTWKKRAWYGTQYFCICTAFRVQGCSR